MSYCAYITRIKNMRKHSNADRLQCGLCFGNNVIVSLNVVEDELGIYFPVDGRLGIEYCVENNLLRKKDEDGNNIGGFLEESKQKIQALKLRGEQSDGLFMPLSSLEKLTNISELKERDQITILDGVKICEKYIPRGNPRRQSNGTPKGKKNTKVDKTSFPLFMEHYDNHPCNILKTNNCPCYVYGEFIVNDCLSKFGRSDKFVNTPKNIIVKNI